MFQLIFLSMSFAQETAIDFEGVEINASAIRPSVQNLLESSRSSEINPMGFQEMCRAMTLESQLGNEYWLNLLQIVNSQHSRNFEQGEYGVCIISKVYQDEYHYTHLVVSDRYRNARGVRKNQGNYVYRADSLYISNASDDTSYGASDDVRCDIFSIFSRDCYAKDTSREIRNYLYYAWTYQQDQETGDILMIPDLTAISSNQSRINSIYDRRTKGNQYLRHWYCGLSGSLEENCMYELPSITIKAIDPSFVDYNKSVYVFSSSYAEEGVICLGTTCQEEPDFYGFMVLL